jgi:hypothetical protein
MKPDNKKILPPPLSKPKESVVNSEAATSFIESGGRIATPAASSAPAVTESQATGRRPGVSASAMSAPSEKPWVEGDPRYKQTVMIKMPEHEYLMLKWLAQTTYGASQTSIVLDALRLHMTQLLEARGLTVSRREDGTLDAN